MLLGRGACKQVFRAFDQREGVEVAWNQVAVSPSLDAAQRERLFAEVRVLRRLTHRNVMAFHDWWFDARAATINFITEVRVLRRRVAVVVGKGELLKRRTSRQRAARGRRRKRRRLEEGSWRIDLLPAAPLLATMNIPTNKRTNIQ